MNGTSTDLASEHRESNRVLPGALVFDVNQTLSDMSPLAQRFADVGVAEHLADTWFASLLRDGFALTAAGVNPAFADIAKGLLREHLAGEVADSEAGVEHIMAGFAELPVHPDVVPGILDLAKLELRLMTLSNGSTSVADALLERSGVRSEFNDVLSVEDADLWKPAKTAYALALQVSGLPAGEVMLVAVHPWDIDGAHRAGLRTAWINRDGRRYPGHFAKPDLEVTSVTDLAAQLVESRSPSG